MQKEISPIQALLIDRTVGLLLADTRVHGPMLRDDDVPFVCVMPHLVGSEVSAWVLLTRGEFMQMFGPEQKRATLQ